MNRKLISIVLLCMWMFTCSSSFLAYQLERYYCHLENFGKDARKLRDQQFVEFEFSNPEMINWQVRNKEIEIDRRFYDVIEMKVYPNKVTLKCVSDAKETHSRADYLADSKAKSQHSKTSHLKPVRLTFIAGSVADIQKLMPVKTGQWGIYTIHSYFIAREIHSPPPEA